MTEKFSVKALHSYSKAKPEELELKDGDTVRVTNDDDPSWWVGTNDRTKENGWFPSSFVQKIESKPKPKLRRRVRVIKRYDATDEDDLSLEVGDIVDVKKEVDGWYLGRHNGNIGMFPVNYAEEHIEDTPAAARPLPQPPKSLSRRGTAGPESTLPQPPLGPPVLPARNPPLPPRASTDMTLVSGAGERMHAALTSPLSEEDLEAKKEKKSGRRISRLFGTKKNKHKDEPAESSHADDLAGLSLEEPMVTSPPPPAARALPPTPPVGIGKAPAVPMTAPPAPVPAPAPAPAPAVPAPSVPAPAPAPAVPVQDARRPSADDAAKDSSSPAGTRPSTAKSAASDDEDEVQDAEEAAHKTRGQAKLAKIIQDYEAASPEELNLMKDDVVTIISRGTDDEPRWKGEYHGKKGYFPGTVIEPIEESSALDEGEGEEGSRPKGGFRLAAYGVQQGGLGSLFAVGGGMPALRKSAPRKNSEAEPSEEPVQAPAPAPAPSLPKLRSVPRPPKDATPKKEEEQPNFLAQLNRVPRKQVPSVSSEDSASVSPRPMAAPTVPISRKSTLANEADAESEPKEASESPNLDSANVSELRSVPELSSSPPDAAVPQDASLRPQTASSKSGEDEVAEDEAPKPEDDVVDEPSVDEKAEEAKTKASAYDPIRSPALPQVKRLVRRGPRQMPTAEGLKKGSGESQAQTLRTALQNDKDAEPEPESPKPAPPPVSEKPKGPRFGPFSGPQLPTGGFKASGRVGSAMASRLAALQARAVGGEEEEEPARAMPTRSTPDATSPPPPPVARKPSFSPRASVEQHVESTQPPAVSAEWQKKVEDEQSQLRSEIERARKSGEQVEQLAARLASSERENQAHKQTISGLERRIETLVSQMAALKSDISGIQRSVSGLESNKGVSANEVTTILRGELQGALEPLHKQNQEHKDDSKKLDKKIAELRAYVDELVVEEEE
ncbi:hypothetical protein GGF43_001928 [Coemansia sp. RSA 2618]|nr:hypothetical protein GGF43_001928 [Coemansia sp. RSA 2618]